MINENIKNARKAKGMTQEEFAVKLNVVRQTVSKWEKGLSVPDADVLIKISEVLDVSVDKLLGVTAFEESEDLSEELARLNEELAAKNKEFVLMGEMNKKRGMIIFLSFVAMLISLSVKNEVVSVVLSAVCIIGVLIILYRNLSLMTGRAVSVRDLSKIRLTTVFNIILLVFTTMIIVLDKSLITALTESEEKIMAVAVITAVILFSGFVSPKLPFNRHTGLRLPWTVQDEETWNVAHRIIGYISLPIVILYLGAVCTIKNLEAVTLAAILLWIGIPGVGSFVFWRRKYCGK